MKKIIRFIETGDRGRTNQETLHWNCIAILKTILIQQTLGYLTTLYLPAHVMQHQNSHKILNMIMHFPHQMEWR